MKTRNLFLSLFAFAAICACNKEAQPETPQVLDAETYVKVNIMATGASTRADYVIGETEENDVKNALFLLYDDSGNPVMYATPTLSFSPNAEDGHNIAKSATIVIPAKKVKPTKMVVILNYADVDKDTYTSANLSNLKKMPISDFAPTIDGIKYYTMTNSVYTDDASNAKTSEDVICEVNLTNDNFGENAVEGGTESATPVNVYVERVAAKVILKEKAGGIVVTASEEEVVVIDGTEFKKENLTITPTILGYDVTEDAQKSYLTKKVLPDWDYAGWTNPGDFRSYWAESIATPGYNYKDFSEIDDTPTAVYVHENTTINTTKVILAAQLKVGGNKIDLVQYNGSYYNIDSFKLLAKNTIETNTEYVVDVTDFNILTKESGAPIESYQMILGVDYGSGSEAKTAAINDILDDMVVMYWKEGHCYYYAEIKHDIPAVAGVVRNHVYELSLNSLEGLGISVPGIGGGIDPETPTDMYYSLNATINILEWRLVKQDVSFN